MNTIFCNPTKGQLNLEEVVEEIKKYIINSPQHCYQLIIGTDSHCNHLAVDFVVAIVIYQLHRGGRYFWTRVKKDKKHLPTLRDRIYQETILSIEMAQKFMPKIKKMVQSEDFSENSLEIHIDVGQNGPTREMISEVVGMVRGNGFQAKTKPEAYVASTVADRYT